MAMHINSRSTLVRTAAALLVAGTMAAAPAARAQEHAIERVDWSFGGIFGQFDQAQLQRGFQVYKQVCQNCHAINRIAFRNLTDKGGPEFPVASIQSMAAVDYKVEDGPDDSGKMFMRSAKLSDHMPSPYKNDQEGRYLHNGVLPPDLSLMARARNVESDPPWYIHPFLMLRDIAAGYQQGGADYIHALMLGYGDPPSYVRDASGKLVPVKEGDKPANAEQCVTVDHPEGKPDVCNPLLEGMLYNSTFPGGQIAMPPPLQDGLIPYSDGTPTKVANYAEDVSAFLSWTADPNIDARKRLGWEVVLFLVVTSVLLYIGKKRLWSRIPH